MLAFPPMELEEATNIENRIEVWRPSFSYLCTIDTLVSIWNLLWEYQAILILPLVLVVWIAVRGYDLGKWIGRKTRKKDKEIQELNHEEESPT